MQGKYVPSILAAIGGVIEQHMVAIGFLAGEGMGLKSDPQAEGAVDTPKGAACPKLRSIYPAKRRRLHDLRKLRVFKVWVRGRLMDWSGDMVCITD